MSFRRRTKYPRYKKSKGTQTRRKKKECCKCCKQCIARTKQIFRGVKCCRWLNNKVFKNPDLDSYEIGGQNVGSVARGINSQMGSKFYLKILNTLKNYSLTDVKRKFSIEGSKSYTFDKLIEDFKTGKLTRHNIQSSKSKIDVRKINKKQVNEILEDYEKMQRRARKNENLDADELKEKFKISGSRAKILDEFVSDLRKEKPSVTSLVTKRKFDPDTIDKKEMRKILKKFDKDSQAIKKRIKENEHLDADELKEKFSVYGRKAKILDAFVEDLKKGKKSTVGLPVKRKFDPNNITREEMNKILEEYAETSPELQKLYDKYRHLSIDDLKRRFSITNSDSEMAEGFLSRLRT